MRLFTAVNICEAGRDELCDTMRRMKAAGVAGSFTARENLHVTLVFIGETTRAGDVRAAMDGVSFAPFEFSVSGAGRFVRDEGDIIWAGVAGRELGELQKILAGALASRGFRVEERAYRPHVTLCRRAVLPVGVDLSAFAPEFCPRVDRVSLYKSEFTNGAVKYTEIFSKRL